MDATELAFSGAAEQARLIASSTAWNLRPIIFGAIAIVLAIAAVVVWRRSRRARSTT